jgi:hypothetical protein
VPAPVIASPKLPNWRCRRILTAQDKLRIPAKTGRIADSSEISAIPPPQVPLFVGIYQLPPNPTHRPASTVFRYVT